MRFKKGTMVHGEKHGVEFIGTISGETRNGLYELTNPIMKMDKWVNILDSIYEREDSFLSEVDVDMFDILHDIKKTDGILFKDYVKSISAAAGSTV